MDWILAHWLPLYLGVGIFFSALAAQDGSRSGLLASTLWGFFWPLLALAVIFHFVITGFRR